MTALKRSQSTSINNYLDGEEVSTEKHEYLGGTVHAMAGVSNQHNAIAENCFAALHGALRGKPCQPFNSDTKIHIQYPDHTRFYYPDAMVVCQTNPGTDHFQDQPVVVIEVLSDSTRRADLVEKRDAYLTIPSLKVLLFIEPESPLITLYRSKSDGGFTQENHSGLASVIALPEIVASLPLAEVYERVELAS